MKHVTCTHAHGVTMKFPKWFGCTI